MGSREFEYLDLFERYMELLFNTFGYFQLISGGAEGPDNWAEVWVRQRDWDTNWPTPIIHTPNWYPRGVYYAGAGTVRNTKIVNDAECVIAFWDGKSRGTMDTVKKALAAHKPVVVVWHDGHSVLNPEFDYRENKALRRVDSDG